MIDLVWDRERLGSVVGPRGASLTVGDGAMWSPEDLLATAAASCLMRTFLKLASEEQINVLGYVVAGRVENSTHPIICLQAAVAVSDGEDVPRVYGLYERARRTSVVARLLDGHLAVETNVHVICECDHRG